MTNYRQKYLRDTVSALNTLNKRGSTYVDTKMIRRELNIPSSNRSEVNFIWMSLKTLEERGYLTKEGRDTPKLYYITTEDDIELDHEE